MKSPNFLIGFCLFLCISGNAQNSLTGDGFGGRLWYRPSNYSAGSYSVYTIQGSNSQLYGWGRNKYSQLGNGNSVESATPVLVQGLNDIKYFTAGYTCAAIKCDGTGWAWGFGYQDKYPVQVIQDVKFADAGSHSASFVKNDGTVWSIGRNFNGEFGTGQITPAFSYTPKMMRDMYNVVRVACGSYCTAILKSDGTVWACGNNNYGGLGNNMSPSTLATFAVPVNTLTAIVDIKADARTFIALDSNGHVWQWGAQTLGIGKNDFSPVQIPNLNNIIAISGCDDGDHFLALDVNKKCYGWGMDSRYFGGVSGGAITPKLVDSNVVDIIAGELFSYIVKSDHTLWASGDDVSIWMNLPPLLRPVFTRIEPEGYPMFLKPPVLIDEYIETHDTISVCPGDSILLKGRYYKANTNCYDSIPGNNCNRGTLLITHIVGKGNTYYVTLNVCKGDTVQYGKVKYFYRGKFYQWIKGNMQCDTLKVITIRVLEPTVVALNTRICEGEYYYFNHHLYTNPGVYIDTLKSALGCDSLVQTYLQILPRIYSNIYVTLCDGKKQKISNKWYTITGVFNDTLRAISGCDSILVITIALLPKSMITRHLTICSGQQYQVGMSFHTTTGEYFDTLRNSYGCDSVIHSFLNVTPPLRHQLERTICHGESISIGNHTYKPQGDFDIYERTSLGCDSIISVKVKFFPTAIISLPNDTFLCEEEQDTITLDAGNHHSYKWYPGGEITQSINVTQAGIYKVEVVNAYGCQDTHTVHVVNLCRPRLHIPNAFSPNGDGLNDEFKPYSEFILEYEMVIFNRWGETIFSSHNPDIGWDGNYKGVAAQQDIYIYRIKAKGTYHQSFNKQGTFELVR